MGWSITDSEALENAIFEMKFRLAKEIGVEKGMTVVDVGCGQGGFTAALARTVGARGKVIAVDVSEEYLEEFWERLDKYGMKNRVTFTRMDAADLRSVVSDEVADLVASYRLLEELKQPGDMGRIVKEMAHITRKGGKICLTELTTEARSKAEEIYIRLHRESGDSFFRRNEIVEAMDNAGLTSVDVEIFDTDIWFSPEVARQDLGFAQVWFNEDVERNLGQLIDRYGMKYPVLLIFSGKKK